MKYEKINEKKSEQDEAIGSAYRFWSINKLFFLPYIYMMISYKLFITLSHPD